MATSIRHLDCISHPAGIPNLQRTMEDIRLHYIRPCEPIPLPITAGALLDRLQIATRYSSVYVRDFAYCLRSHLLGKFKRIEQLNRLNPNHHVCLWLNNLEADAVRAVLIHEGGCTMYAYEQNRQNLPTSFNTSSRNCLEHRLCRTTQAAQRAISDLYGGYIHCIHLLRAGQSTSLRTPLLTWGNVRELGPYTRTIEQVRTIGLPNPIVSFPLVFNSGGLLAWTTFAHEVAGHDILHAIPTILSEIKETMLCMLLPCPEETDTVRDFEDPAFALDVHLAKYWADRVDETVSDVLGFLNLGPSALMGLIAYFRAVRQNHRLAIIGPANDVHPADILRVMLGVEIIKRLPIFRDKQRLIRGLEQEILSDYSASFREIVLAGVGFSFERIRASAEGVAKIILEEPLSSLNGQALGAIRTWNETDEAGVASIRALWREGHAVQCPYPPNHQFSYFAIHTIVAATMESLQLGVNIQNVFWRMIDTLNTITFVPYRPIGLARSRSLELPST